MKKLLITLLLLNSSAAQAETLLDILSRKKGADVEYEGPLVREDTVPQAFVDSPPEKEAFTIHDRCDPKLAISIMKKKGFTHVRFLQVYSGHVEIVGSKKGKRWYEPSDTMFFANTPGCPELKN